MSFEHRVTWIIGGSNAAGAVEARVGLPDGTFPSTRELSAPAGVLPGMRFFVLALPPAVRPTTLQVVTANDTVLEE